MKSNKPNDRLPRDATLARLLAEALDSKAAGDVKSAACPDTEVLAAYAEHGLSGQEASRWEGHIADCGRCQKIIAGVVVSGENLADAEIQEQGSLVSASAVRKPELQPAALEISRRPSLWRWWAPAIGLAAAVALWFALHPVLPPKPASPRAAVTAGTSQSTAQGNTAASSAKPEETQMAQANVPPPPPAGISGGKLRDSEEPRANPSADALKKSPKQGSLQNERQTPMSPAVSEVARAEASTAAKEKDGGAPSAQEMDAKRQTTDALAETPAPPTAAAPPAAEPAPAPEASQTQGLARQLDRSAGFSSTNQVRALAKTLSSSNVFASPDRSVLWRVGPAGLIENSIDQGKTWQRQASGVTADLVAGAAPSAKIAWAVGKGGIILRTEDGEHWQRVTPPSVAQKIGPPDWVAIDARDELHATVGSPDLHRYATTDGGRTWVQEQ
jgi:hypothetical protein